MKIKGMLYYMEQLLFVPRCVGCDIRLGQEDADGEGNIPPLCPECMNQYIMMKESSCPVCMDKLKNCLCTTYDMRRQGLSRMVKLFRYEPRQTDLPSNRLIYALKHKDLRIVTEFLARELAPLVRKHVRNPEEWCLAYAPRSKKRRRVLGFDQSERLAKALSKELQIPVIDCLVRHSSAGVQKTLNRTQRFLNMRSSFEVKPRISLAGRKILLVDDIVTTGATLTAAATTLRKSGAKTVVAIAPGAAYRHVTPAQRRRASKKYKVSFR